ncbi:carbamoyltransferase C-terminal domain-containing protein [Actinomyces wuliandei]|uniref:carbamoyltransferase C-terminal domain-containing protein n=1 Tax=Actinomyces wuliandei TaxID=2057743 RepID=UPI000FDCCEC7|nr:carbamoyltransferase C-terminal domain-containing protein [Actinomyces wuliandei]
MKVLALHSVGHDSGAAVVEDGRVIYSIETERLTRRRYDHRVDLAIGAVTSQPEHPLNSFDWVALTTPIGHPAATVPDQAQVMERLRGRRELHVETTCEIRGQRLPCIVVTHEVSHAMLAAHYSGYAEDCLVLVNEGQGQFTQNALFTYRDGHLDWVDSDVLPWWGRGLGWTGMGVLFDMGNSPGVAGRLMALSAYGQPDKAIREQLVGIPDRIVTDRSYAYDVATELRDAHFADGFQRRADIICTFQELFTQAVTSTVAEAMERHQCGALALGGGCALNIVTNTALRDIHGLAPSIAPACNDSGHPLGAAAYAWYLLSGSHLLPFSVYNVGVEETPSQRREALRAGNLTPLAYDEDTVVEVLAEGGVVAMNHGLAESGPRALGHRSLLANPRIKGMKERVSQRLKAREWYRPLAGLMTKERFAEMLPGCPDSPHMLFDYKIPASMMPEARHRDGTSRLQTLSRSSDPVLHSLLTSFSARTGVPGLINTSLNSAGRSIAQTTDDMLTDFLRTEVDLFVSGDFMARQL